MKKFKLISTQIQSVIDVITALSLLFIIYGCLTAWGNHLYGDKELLTNIVNLSIKVFTSYGILTLISQSITRILLLKK